MMLHLMHIWPQFAQELPDIHFRLHFGHLYSPKHLFLPWYGVNPRNVEDGAISVSSFNG